MAASIETVVDELIAVLAVGTHAHVDLSGSDQVVLGDPPDQLGPTGSRAQVFVVPGEMAPEGPGTLRQWDERWRVTLMCYAQGDTATVSDRTRAALRLAEDVWVALRSSFLTAGSTLNSSVRDVDLRQTLGPMLGGAWGLMVIDLEFTRSVGVS